MLYKLMIVDDEVTIVEGLCNIVDWKSLGFEVVCTASDGREAIEHLEKTPVDVILTDIKMTFISGIELAKHVLKNKLNSRVVIMSGYKEFELAREALMCNVKYYLLKPTRLDELRDVFLTIKDELDAEQRRYERLRSNREEFNELLSMYQEQFFTDLTMGAVRTRDAVDRRIKARLEIDPRECRLCVYSLWFSGGEENPESQSIKKHLLDTTFHNYAAKQDAVKYIIVPNSTDSFQILAVALAKMDGRRLEEESQAILKKIAEKLDAVLGIDVKVRREKSFENLYDVATYYKPLIPAPDADSNKLEDIVDAGDFSHLLRQKRLFLTYVNANNPEMAESLFENFIDELKFMKVRVIHNFLIDLFAGIKIRLEELDINMDEDLFDYHSVFRLSDVEQIRQWGLSLLRRIFDYIEQYKGTLHSSVVEKAKNYIRDHFDEDIGLDEVSAHVFLSSIYFSHLFKQKTGENFVDYLLRVRMGKAMEFLREPQYKIYEVSEKVGYRNTKYFYKLFKSFTGLTPAEYRTNSMKGQAQG